MTIEKAMNRKEFRDALGVSNTTFWRLQKSGLLPQPILKSGTKLVLWSRSDVKSFLSGGSEGNCLSAATE